jgi:hypothetical protein
MVEFSLGPERRLSLPNIPRILDVDFKNRRVDAIEAGKGPVK